MRPSIRSLGLLAVLGAIKGDGVHVPFQGAGPMSQALLGGTIMAFTETPSVAKASNLPILASLTKQRQASIPDVPTAKELGYDAVFCNEHNLYAPKGTPPERIAVLAQAFSKALATDYVKKEYKEKLGATIEVRTGKELEQRLAADLEKFKPMTTNMKPN